MKHICWAYILMIVALMLAGCKPGSQNLQPTLSNQLLTPTLGSEVTTTVPSTTLTPIATVEQLSSPTVNSIIYTPTPSISISPTVVDTLEPDKANEAIKTLLREPTDCSAPCFWGIVPGQSTLDEADKIFSHLGLQMANTTSEGKDFSGIGYNLDSGLSFRVILTTKSKIVENLRIKINPEKQKTGIARDWSAYSPETLIKRYGMPSRVEFIADWGPGPLFAMQMYFDTVDLIVQYAGENIILSKKGSSKVCPLTAQFDSVWLWMGKDPVYPPGKGVSLEKATTLTMEEFSKLMTGDPNNACFTFNGNAFQ